MTNVNTSVDLRIRKKLGRSAITNGVVGLDARGRVARRFRDICSEVMADQGGRDRIGEVRLQLIRRFSAICLLAEHIEEALARGERIRADELQNLANTATRIAARLGLDRIPKNVTPDLRDYLDARSAERTATLDDGEQGEAEGDEE